MILRSILPILFILLVAGATVVYAQPEFPPDPTPRIRRPRRDAPKGFDEMLAKQKAERDKRDHRQMLERGEAALRLATELETAFASNKTLNEADRERLVSLEKIVEKIREELGGGDDGTEELNYQKEAGEPRPSTLEDAFKYLQSTTVKLVDELKKTTRFTISAVAIQTSNNVLKLVKFLRLRK